MAEKWWKSQTIFDQITIFLAISTKQFGGRPSLIVAIRSIVFLFMTVETLNSRLVMIFPFVSNKGLKRGILRRDREAR